MSDYMIFSDSCADLTPELVRRADVSILGMHFTLQGKSYLHVPEETGLSSPEFYALVRAGEMPTTAQINTARFVEAFEPVLREGADILYLAFSSGLSGTYQAACLAAEELRQKYPERRVTAVDTLAASMGEGLLV